MKQNRLRCVVLTAAFCGFLALFLILLLFSPKADFSPLEKRTLAKMPSLTWRGLLDGSFESDFEDWLSDHMPLREELVELHAGYELFSFRNGLNEVVRETDGALCAVPEEADEALIRRLCGRINDFAGNIDLPVTVMLLPTAGYLAEDTMPVLPPVYHDGEAAALARQSLAEEIDFLWPEDVLSRNLYYRTDHHLTSEGAWTAYNQYLLSLNRPIHERDEYEVEAVDGFCGTAYAKSGLWNTKPDALEIWQYRDAAPVTVSFDDRESADTLFFREHLEEMDKYPVFLDGNHALVTIENTSCEGETLLLVRDSFGHCVAPFAAEDFGKIVLVDLRYYHLPVSELVREVQADRVLFLYGLDTFLTDSGLAWLK